MTTLRSTGVVLVNLLTSSGGSTPTIVTTPLHMANQAELSSEMAEITFEGDGEEVVKRSLKRVQATITLDTLDYDAIKIAMGKTAVTTGIPTEEASRILFGESSEDAGFRVGLEIIAVGEDIDGGKTRYVKVVIPQGDMSTADAPSFSTKAKAQTKLMINSIRSTKDIIGTALPGASAKGYHWHYTLLKDTYTL